MTMNPKLTVYNTKMCLLYNKPKQLHTPPQSPDVNPIEQVLEILDEKLGKGN